MTSADLKIMELKMVFEDLEYDITTLLKVVERKGELTPESDYEQIMEFLDSIRRAAIRGNHLVYDITKGVN